MSKRPSKSKTIHLGVIVTAISVCGLLIGEEWIQDYPIAVAALGVTSGILTIILRLYTKEPIGRKGSK